MRIMYVFFLGVVPFIALSLFLLYYWQQNRPWFISQSPTNEYVPKIILNNTDSVVLRKNLEITETKLVYSTNSKIWPVVKF